MCSISRSLLFHVRVVFALFGGIIGDIAFGCLKKDFFFGVAS